MPHVTKGAKRTVGISELIVSKDRSEELITYSLGSCIGVSMFDEVAGVGGLIHCMLPLSKVDPEKAKARPAMFVDTGLVFMLKRMYALGAQAERLIVKVAGAASPMDTGGRFKIGERNVTVLRKVLWKNEVLLNGDDVGGTSPRTMSLRLSDGTTLISSGSKQWDL